MFRTLAKLLDRILSGYEDCEDEEDIYGQRAVFEFKFRNYSLTTLKTLRASSDYRLNPFFRDVVEQLIMERETTESVRTHSRICLAVDNTQ